MKGLLRLKKFDVIFPKDFLITLLQKEVEWKRISQSGYLVHKKVYPKGGLLKDYKEPEKLKSESESNLKESQPK